MRRLLALVTTLAVLLAAPALAGGPNHVVTASPASDGQALHRSGVQVATTGADTVDSTNLARALPHDCTGCEGIAVAFQAVIATGDPSTASPRNAAVAVNSNCTSCGAFAFAYQYYVTADGPTSLSDDGRAQVADIRARADQLVDAGLPYPDLDARLQELGAEFKAAVAGDLQSHGEHPRDGQVEERTRTDGAAP